MRSQDEIYKRDRSVAMIDTERLATSREVTPKLGYDAPTKTLHWRRGFDWKLDLNIIVFFSLLPLCLVNYLLLPVHFFSQFRTLIFVSEQGAPARVPVLPNEYSISSNATRRCTPYYLVESLPGVTVPLAASMFFSSDLGIDYGKNRLMLTGWVFYCVYQKELL